MIEQTKTSTLVAVLDEGVLHAGRGEGGDGCPEGGDGGARGISTTRGARRGRRWPPRRRRSPRSRPPAPSRSLRSNGSRANSQVRLRSNGQNPTTPKDRTARGQTRRCVEDRTAKTLKPQKIERLKTELAGASKIGRLTPYLGLEMLLSVTLSAGVLSAVLVRDWSIKDSGPDRTPKDNSVWIHY
eukprot:489642-Prorocentrum_minimum.AAC.2